MATIKKPKKAQTGDKLPKGYVRTEMGRPIKKTEQDKWEAGMADALDRQAGLGKYAPKKNEAINNKPLKEGKSKKMEEGGKAKSFPDLNKDGKITKADVLVGRGVIKAKKGTKAKPCMNCGGKMAKGGKMSKKKK